ncbi:hypothetical protein ACVWWG_005244 [Bradyrhizobium sp. LB7.2]
MVRWPSVPEPAVTTVLNSDWPASASVAVIWPETDKVGALSSVTSWNAGSLMTAASLVPWTSNDTVLGVPSSEWTVKVSMWVWPAPSDWVAVLATE